MTKLKRAYYFGRETPPIYTIEEAVKETIERDYGADGQIEELEAKVEVLIEIVGKLVAGERDLAELLPRFEVATDEEIKAREEA